MYVHDIHWAGTDVAATHGAPLWLLSVRQVWTQITTQQYSAWVVNENNQTTKDVKGVLYLSNTLPLTIRITRSAFTKSYAVVLVIFLWLIGGLNLMHCLDSVFVRPRDLADAFAPALLFALPSFRNTMPGIPPVSGRHIHVLFACRIMRSELTDSMCPALNDYVRTAASYS